MIGNRPQVVSRLRTHAHVTCVCLVSVAAWGRFLVASGFYRTFAELSAMLGPLVELLDGSTDMVRDDDVLKSLTTEASTASRMNPRYTLNKWTQPIMEAKLAMYVHTQPFVVLQSRCSGLGDTWGATHVPAGLSLLVRLCVPCVPGVRS